MHMYLRLCSNLLQTANFTKEIQVTQVGFFKKNPIEWSAAAATAADDDVSQ